MRPRGTVLIGTIYILLFISLQHKTPLDITIKSMSSISNVNAALTTVVLISLVTQVCMISYNVQRLMGTFTG